MSILSLRLPSFKRSIIFAFLLLALLASAFYLRAEYEVDLPSELDIAISPFLEDFGSWASRIGPSSSGNGGLDPAPSVVSSSTPASLLLNFNSSVSPGVFRTWGDLTLQGGSNLSYLILNATLWDGDRIVESTRYMMIEVVPGESRSFDIRERSRLRPERGYSSRLEVEEPEEFFVSERRDCLVVEDDSGGVIWEDTGSIRDDEDEPKGESSVSLSSSESAKAVSTSSSSRSTERYREVEDSSEDLGPEEEDQSSGSSSGDEDELEAEEEVEIGGEVETEEKVEIEGGFESEEEVGTDSEDDKVLYVGSTTSNKYHRPDCRYAVKIKEENKIPFYSVEEAEEAGYVPCKVCNPV